MWSSLRTRMLFRALSVTRSAHCNFQSRCASGNKSESWPLLGRQMLKYFEPEEGKCFIDLTFNEKSDRARMLTEHRQMSRFEAKPDMHIATNDIKGHKEVKSDSDQNDPYPSSVNISKLNYFFSDLCSPLMTTADISPDSVDGIVIDCTNLVPTITEWLELDLRFDCGQLRPEMPTASEFLMMANDVDLQKVLKTYGSLPNSSKVAATAIVEARYLGNVFQTVSDLREALQPAGRILGERLDQLSERDRLSGHLLQRTLDGLRLFVNDHINELEFAIRVIAENYLKQGTGILFVIASNPAEEKLVSTALNVAVVPQWKLGGVRSQPHQLSGVKEGPWQILEETPHTINDTHDPNTKTSKNNIADTTKTLFVARRTYFQRSSDDLIL